MKKGVNISAGLFYGLRLFGGAYRNRSSRKRFLGAVLGISLCLVPLILVVEVTDGMIEGITDRYLELGSFHLQARNYFRQSPLDLSDPNSSFKDIQGLVSVTPFFEGVGLLWAGGRTSGVTVRAYPDSFFKDDMGSRKYISVKEGAFYLDQGNGILLSQGLSDSLKVKAGDNVKLVTGRTLSGGRLVLRPTDFTVAGIYSTGYQDLDKISSLISLESGNILFRDAGSMILGFKVENPYGDLSGIEEDLLKALPPNWYLYTWYELEKPMYKSFVTTKNLLSFIMAIILLVAVVNISGSLVIVVLEKGKEIAILKSLGINSATIQLGFITAGFICGFIGTLIGTILGVLCVNNINEILNILEAAISLFSDFTIPKEYYLQDIPVSLSFKNLAGIAVLSLGLSLGASYFPARRASRLSPLEVLRKH